MLIGTSFLPLADVEDSREKHPECLSTHLRIYQQNKESSLNVATCSNSWQVSISGEWWDNIINGSRRVCDGQVKILQWNITVVAAIDQTFLYCAHSIPYNFLFKSKNVAQKRFPPALVFLYLVLAPLQLRSQTRHLCDQNSDECQHQVFSMARESVASEGLRTQFSHV